MLVSALNERLEQMDVGHARKVFVDGFLRNRDGYRMEIPLVPLGDLYGKRLESWLADRGVDRPMLTTGVRAVEAGPTEEFRRRRRRFRSGEPVVNADFVVLAVPFDRVRFARSSPTPSPVASPSLRRGRCRSHGLADHRRAPLVRPPGLSVRPRRHDRADDPVGVQPHRDPGPWPGDAGGRARYLQIVISASYDLVSMDKTAIRDALLAELGAIWPAAREANLLRWWVVTEHGATFAVRPGIDALRPVQRTPVEGLFLAGDWTATGWPATMEGAVRSGYLAAERILEDLGRPAMLLAARPRRGPSVAAQLLGSPPLARSPGRPFHVFPGRSPSLR